LEVRENTVVTFEYELRVDGEVVDASPEGEPVTVLVGHALWLPPGLERVLVGRNPGPFEAVVPPERGAGEHDPGKVAVVGREEFPEGSSLEEGEEFHAQDEGGRPVAVRVVAVEGDRITVDANPEYAGKALEYSGEIQSVREAAPEEMDHGHVHGEGGIEH
jgi:FKBP-type peptidyl-prolyl cis-trans isomerase SlyD